MTVQGVTQQQLTFFTRERAELEIGETGQGGLHDFSKSSSDDGWGNIRIHALNELPRSKLGGCKFDVNTIGIYF